MPKRDYYEVLGVARNATEQDIKRAFRAKAMEHHPDRNKDPAAEARFKEVNEAYDVLSDQRKRALYDQYGHRAVDGSAGHPGAGPQGADFSDIFGSIFGDGESPFADIFGGFQAGGRRQRRGADVQRIVDITFRQWVLGTTVHLDVKRSKQCPHCHGSGGETPSDVRTCPTCDGHGVVVQTRRTPFGNIQSQAVCPTCRGKGKTVKKECHVCRGDGYVQVAETVDVDLPSGISDGEAVVLRGYGKRGDGDAPPGDLYVAVRVARSSRLSRRGDDVVVKLPVDPFLAMAGGRVRVPTFSGVKEINLPKGTAPGDTVTVSGEGFASGKTFKRRGDMVVVVDYAPLRHLSREEAERLSAMAEHENPAQSDGFDKIAAEVG